MAPDTPVVTDLLITVREFLQQAAPALPAHLRFDSQVAAYLLDIARREIEARLPDVTSRKDEAPLCLEIRAGLRDLEWDATLQDVLDDTIERVRIVRPAYLAPEYTEASS